jgi:hypothetical protein
MPTFKKANEIRELAGDVLAEYESHQPLIDHKVTIDFVFAYCDRDEDSGEPINFAITERNRRVFGITSIIPLKGRVKGLGDVEILIDGDWWHEATAAEQKALLDHELHHVSVKISKGVIQYDSHGRPKIKLRPHDLEVGWFKVIAERHGSNSFEVKQAAAAFDAFGQAFWPELTAALAPKELPPAGKKRS